MVATMSTLEARYASKVAASVDEISVDGDESPRPRSVDSDKRSTSAGCSESGSEEEQNSWGACRCANGHERAPMLAPVSSAAKPPLAVSEPRFVDDSSWNWLSRLLCARRPRAAIDSKLSGAVGGARPACADAAVASGEESLSSGADGADLRCLDDAEEVSAMDKEHNAEGVSALDEVPPAIAEMEPCPAPPERLVLQLPPGFRPPPGLAHPPAFSCIGASTWAPEQFSAPSTASSADSSCSLRGAGEAGGGCEVEISQGDASVVDFDAVSFHRTVVAIMRDLAVDGNTGTAVARVRAEEVPLDRQAEEFAELLTRAVELGNGRTRRSALAFAAGLAAGDAERSAFKRSECATGVGIFFGEVYADLCEDVPQLPRIVNQELLPTLRCVLSDDELRDVLPAALAAVALPAQRPLSRAGGTRTAVGRRRSRVR
eukprot:TRINITY_DN57625_c0_g1_i1.p1 TRINITY_DN57625_c0_g1~~TRINITY_DN57625_c0_g1_i1.p1  ORF type:complete len:431 (+),score=75.48 TRINITY_DN57625_c0_g1_i1:111-1403(+)